MASSNGSMAIWCEAPLGPSNIDLEAHLNYWRVAGQKRPRHPVNAEDFLEIGLLVTNPSTLLTINIYLPILINIDKVFDIGSRFSNPDIAQGIFNENLSCTPSSGNSWVDLAQATGPFCRVHSFAKDNAQRINTTEMTLSHQDGGTLLRILPAAIVSSMGFPGTQTRLYFRIRVLTGGKNTSPFVKVIKPFDRPLQSGFEEIEYIDFRLNESRTLPDNIERTIRQHTSNGSVPISLVAFLTAVPIVSELTISHTAIHKNRLLEHIPWTNYAPQPLPDGMMVYHWRKSAPSIESFTAFVKLQTRKAGKRTILLYLLVAFCFGVFGNLVASRIDSYFLNPKAPDAGRAAPN